MDFNNSECPVREEEQLRHGSTRSAGPCLTVYVVSKRPVRRDSLDGALELVASLELHHLLGGDDDGLLGSRIDA